MKIVLETKEMGLSMEMCGTTQALLGALAAAVGEMYTRTINEEEMSFDKFMEAFKDDVQCRMKSEKIGIDLSGSLQDILRKILGGCNG